MLGVGRWLASGGVQHISLLGRSGRMELAAPPLHDLMDPGWAASITLQKCDIACSEDAAAVLGHDRSQGKQPIAVLIKPSSRPDACRKHLYQKGSVAISLEFIKDDLSNRAFMQPSRERHGAYSCDGIQLVAPLLKMSL